MLACGGYQTAVQCLLKSLADCLNMTWKISTVLHPQSNGLGVLGARSSHWGKGKAHNK